VHSVGINLADFFVGLFVPALVPNSDADFVGNIGLLLEI
jgi:hypothetical protein